MSTVQQVYESRWGFHPCDHDQFLELKEAHKLVLRALRDCKRNTRWSRKFPHNRKGPEPKAVKSFDDATGLRRDIKLRSYYYKVLAEYRNARYPKPNSHAVQAMDLPRDFEDVVKELKKFYAE